MNMNTSITKLRVYDQVRIQIINQLIIQILDNVRYQINKHPNHQIKDQLLQRFWMEITNPIKVQVTECISDQLNNPR
jgi:hypothetical protein